MTLKNEELLSRYFERKMTSSEEQNFLISVAANDELRLAFRSQLELMRAVSNDKDGIRSAAEVRMRTLAALGLSTLAAESYLEHDLLSRPAQVATEEVKREVVFQSASAPSGFMGFIKSPLATIAGGLAVGFMAAVAIFSSPEPEISRPVQEQISAPQSQIPAAQDLELQQTPQNTANTPVLTEKPAVAAKQNVSASRKPAGETIAPNSGLNSKANGNMDQVEIDKQGTAPVTIKTNINKPKDSTTKK